MISGGRGPRLSALVSMECSSQKAIIQLRSNSLTIQMEEITVKIPKGLPGPYLKKKIDDLVREEVLK